jgi:hypothetical protein
MSKNAVRKAIEKGRKATKKHFKNIGGERKTDKQKTKRELLLEIEAKVEKALAESIRTHKEVERRLKQDRLRKGSS